jgi:pimeloyl-ACP methyl ester carboxylesterase
MLKFEHKNLNLHYQIEGSGDTLLFLHGFLESHSMWNDLVPHFIAQGYSCLTLDLPCHGISRFTGANCSMKSMAFLINQLLLKLKIDVKAIIGHSMGGYVGLELIELRSSQLILLHSNFWADNQQKKLDRDRVIEIVSKNKSLFIKEAIPALFAPENRDRCSTAINKLIKSAQSIPSIEIAAATAGMRDRKSFSLFLKSSDICIIQGEYDPIIATEQIKKEIEENNWQIELVLLKNVGHMSIWEDPKNLIKALKNLIIR